jgi:hypothetical protein
MLKLGHDRRAESLGSPVVTQLVPLPVALLALRVSV